MTYDEALEKIKTEFHRTRTTQKIMIDAEVVAALLGYNQLSKTYWERKDD
jgi:hypothetical protein